MTKPTPAFSTIDLAGLLEMVAMGRIQVPEFQRPVSLRDEWVRTLLASVSLGYPIGAVILLPASEGGYPFPVRPVHGAPVGPGTPELLLVDGQHRISALFQALGSADGVVGFEGGDGHAYVVNVTAAATPGADRVAAIIPEAESDGRRLALRTVFARDPETVALSAPPRETEAPLDEFEHNVLASFRAYQLPVILLDASTLWWTVRVRGGPNGLSLVQKYRSEHDGTS